MFNRFVSRFSQWLAVAAVFGFVGLGSAMAQAEPTMNEIYKTAQSGKLDQAQVMIQQVLIAHPNSAKAHFVQAELFARQGLAGRGREALVTADKLAPGLPFAKPEAVQALRAQLASRPEQSAVKELGNKNFAIDTPATATSTFPFGMVLLLVAGVIAIVVWLIRRKPAAAPIASAAYASPAAMGASGGLNGPQTFGSGLGGGAMAPGYGQAGGQPGLQPGYGQPAYGQPAATGMGGRVMGGLATGLAVGAGVMAAQAIGKNLMGHNEQPAHLSDGPAGTGNGHETLAGNNDMGGQNFGINDGSSWDDGGGSADIGGGGDWDT
ncbi:MAG: hypothetical protein H7228_06620 [Polaromonas sp.]|nr:hypothetical protein [Polaromonas sp.]